MPYPTEVTVENGRLVVRRNMDESGYLVVPWITDGAGCLMSSSPTLMERSQPYQIQVELARGKVNQLRNQAAEWLAGGLQMPAALQQEIRSLYRRWRSLDGPSTQLPGPGRCGPDALRRSLIRRVPGRRAGLVNLYTHQVFQVRHQRQSRLDTTLGCRLGTTVPGDELTAALDETFNTVCLPFAWSEVQPAETDFQWQAHDALLNWAQQNGFHVVGGPLIDFSPARLPDWLWLWERDLPSLSSFLSDYVETVIRRYRGRIRSWQLTAGSNCAAVLGLSEDELLWLTVRLAEAARQVEPGLELSIGIAQPWGEYMAVQDRSHSPFMFADTLIRSGVNLAALELEVIMSVGPRGSYCRDLLEVSRLTDLYALLGVPLQITLGYPSADEPDALADPDLTVSAGNWRGGFTPDLQADWVAGTAALTVCKPSVRAVNWVHLFDGEPHQFPACGLVDAAGNAKPALARLHELREKHLAIRISGVSGPWNRLRRRLLRILSL